ncbi:MAG TPA: sugar-binding protein, partial [Lysinibacillus sp.]|nr:sugar-binding protein [Lysinibacillus sp.]
MKNKILAAVICFGFSLTYSQTLPDGQNYVYSRYYLEPVTITTPNAQQIQTVTYLDELGRPKQSINIKATPSKQDLVTLTDFDEYGRQTISYLPLPISSLGGDIQPVVGADVNSFYDNIHMNVRSAFIEKVYDKSPLNRLKTSASPGDDWDMQSPNTVEYEYDVNKIGDNVKIYTAASTWDPTEKIYRSVLSFSGTYITGALYKYKVLDEDNNLQEVYKDSFGKIVLIRKNDGVFNVDTYHVYDQYKKLSFIISPKAVPLDITDSEVLKSLCYQYNYDEWGRLAEKKLPGKEWEYFAYDANDRLAARQDAEMNKSGRWEFSKVDYLGRTVYSGLMNGGDRKDIQIDFNNSNYEMLAQPSSV